MRFFYHTAMPFEIQKARHFARGAAGDCGIALRSAAVPIRLCLPMPGDNMCYMRGSMPDFVQRAANAGKGRPLHRFAVAAAVALLAQAIPVFPGVTLYNLGIQPTNPATSAGEYVTVQATATPDASNLVLTTWYRIGSAGTWNSSPMDSVPGNLYETAHALPTRADTSVQYYVQCTFDSTNAHSPAFAPAGGAGAPASYTATNTYIGLASRQFSPCSRRTPLTISEIMYHPANFGDSNNYEFIEVFNTAPVGLDISGFRIAGDVGYTFPSNTTLEARGYIVVAGDPDALQSRCSAGNVTGPLSTNLPGSKGAVQLLNSSGALLLDVQYSDQMPWPVAADGAGHSLVLRCPDYGEDSVQAWSASALKGGSPGSADPEPHSAWDGVVVNEFLAHTDPPQLDTIELFNGCTQTVDISGCTLSDKAGLRKFTIPANTTLAPGAVTAYDEAQLGFALSMHGSDIYLEAPDGTRVLDAVRFGAQANGVSNGRYPDGAPSFYPLAALTLNQRNTNAAIRVPAVLINEIMFAPLSGNREDQYVELYNNSGAPAEVGYWRLDDGISFMIPPGTTIPAYGYLVIAKDRANLLARYSQLNSTNTLGDFSGSLAGQGERIALTMPDDPALPYQDFVVVDEVTYSDGWADGTKGDGSSLELRDAHSNHRLAMNWAASDETQKAPWTVIDYTDSVNAGAGSTDPFNIWAVEPGEYIVDDIRVTQGDMVNLSEDFESGGVGWQFPGCNIRSAVEAGVGYAGSRGLHVRSSERGECGGSDGRFINFISKNASSFVVTGQPLRIQAKVRWLTGFPFLMIGTRGYWIATPGDLTAPSNLGTPGARNTACTTNSGPALFDVCQSPVCPAPSSNVVITCRVHDPDGVSAVSLKYRVDPSSVTNTIAMRDDGTGGDSLAGDGIFSATLPGQSSGAIAAFVIDATDSTTSPATRRYPPRVVTGRIPPECLVCWGLPQPKGSGGLPTYRALLTQANASLLDGSQLSREPVPATCVYENYRAIYDACFRNHSGISRKGYWFILPRSDKLLGADQILIQCNDTQADEVQRYGFTSWLFLNIGQPCFIMRPAAFARNTAALELRIDFLEASREVCSAWFGDSDPEVFKNQDWYTDAFGMYTNLSGGLKKTVYEGVNRKRAVDHPNDDYSQVFKVATAVATTDPTQYVARVKAVVDTRSWASYCALAGLFGDWDHYGYSYVHNYYAYIPAFGKMRLLMHDPDFMLTDAPGVRWPSSHPVPNRMFVNTPTFTRTYWSVLKDAAEGPLAPARVNKYFDDWYAAYIANGFAAGSPVTFENYVAQSRASALAGLAAIETPFRITTAGGLDFSTNANPLTLSGTAPVYVEEIRINGMPYKVDYASLTNWQLRLRIDPGAHPLTVTAHDHNGLLIPGGTAAITVTGTGQAMALDGNLVINEIMYHPTNSYASYIELRNLSTNTLDLGGLRVDGIDCTIGHGNMIAPTGYVVIAGNISGYQAAYSNAEVVAAEFNGTLSNSGELLRLLRPYGTNWATLDEVYYGSTPPWPAAADGGGYSLQLIDPARDNNRPGNWGVAPVHAPAEWLFVSATGTSFSRIQSPALSLYIEQAGDALVDRVWLSTGLVAEAGSNLISNGDFESPLSGTWSLLGNHAGSALSTNAWSGTNSLGIVATGAGDATNNKVSHGSITLAPNTQYTLSFWHRQSLTGSNLNAEISSTSIRSRSPLAVPLSSLARCTPGAPNSIETNLPPFPALWLNEVMPSNTSFTVDNFGEHAPWIEIYNGGTTALDLADIGLNNAGTNAAGRWLFPPGVELAAGGRMLVWADAQPWQSASNALHTSFALTGSGGSVTLFLAGPAGDIVLDCLAYSNLVADTSVGSYPEGQALIRQVFHTPTPGTANTPASELVTMLINEWMSNNDGFIFDPADRKFQDWFELFNPGSNAVHLGGYWLTDKLSVSNKFLVPGGTFVNAGGYLLVWADNEPEQNGGTDLHVGFSLNNSGEAIGLFAPDGTPVDTVTFGAQGVDQATGRWPDGASPAYTMAPPTPGGPNRVLLFANTETQTNGFSVVWMAETGAVYRLDGATDLPSSNWIPLGLITSAGATATAADTNAPSLPARFYRLNRISP